MRPPTFRVDRLSPLSAAEQLKARVRVAVRAGELRPGTALPRVRVLAQEFGVNAGTVAAVYRELASEGLIVPRGRAGTRVAPGPFLAGPGDEELTAAADRLVAVARRLGRSHAEVLRLVAGRWHAPLVPRGRTASGGRTAYALLATADHDEG